MAQEQVEIVTNAQERKTMWWRNEYIGQPGRRVGVDTRLRGTKMGIPTKRKKRIKVRGGETLDEKLHPVVKKCEKLREKNSSHTAVSDRARIKENKSKCSGGTTSMNPAGKRETPLYHHKK